MKDGIIKNNGTSRLMRATLPETYAEFRAQAASGTLPLDILFNAAGWTQAPTWLSKGNLLSDPTAAALGLTSDPTVDDALSKTATATYIDKVGGEPIYTPVTVNLADCAEGDTVGIYVGGAVKEFFVAKCNYESGLNGAGRTLLVSKTPFPSSYYDTSLSRYAYANSVIDAFLNNDVKSTFSAETQTAMGETVIQSCGATISRAIFLLSCTEVGISGGIVRVEGSALPIAGSIRSAISNSRWSRTLYDGTSAFSYDPGTSYNTSSKYSNSLQTQIAFTLPSDFSLTYYTDSGGNKYAEQAYTPIVYSAADALGEIIGGFTQIETGSYVGTGTYGSGNPNSVTLGFEPKMFALRNSQSYDGMMGWVLFGDLNDALMISYTPNMSGPGNGNYASRVTKNGHVISWYATGTVASQYNSSGCKYDYIAIS